MEERHIITIEDGYIYISGDNVWMTVPEIANLFYVTSARTGWLIKRILKEGVLKENETCRCVPLGNGYYADMFSLDIIIDLSFRINTAGADLFRKWLKEHIQSGKKDVSFFWLSGKKGIVC